MKILITLFICSFVFFSCKNDSGGVMKNIDRDTVQEFAVWPGYQLKGAYYGDATFITVDSLIISSKDTTKGKRQWGEKWEKVTYAVCPVPVTLDSALASFLKTPLLDSLGKVRTVTVPVMFESKYVVRRPVRLQDALDSLLKLYPIREKIDTALVKK